jgi:hypothetical protein
MKRTKLSAIVHTFALVLFVMTVSSVADLPAAQRTGRRPRPRASICGNPSVACKTTVTFKDHDLPFRVPQNSVIFDTELFYAVILKSVRANEDDCNTFIPETERLQAQALFPDRKVFSSRCYDIENLFYTNVDSKVMFMAVYGGTTLADAKRTQEAVRASGKFPGAYLRRMRTGFNGT